MSIHNLSLKRRQFLIAVAAFSGSTLLWNMRSVRASTHSLITKMIPSTGQRIPAIGMGSWITFNVGNNAALRQQRQQVLKTFFAMGGSLIDSSPMYGSSEEVIGECLKNLDNDQALFSATKVWTPLQWHGIKQMESSEKLWGLDDTEGKRFDLLQIHNLLSWESHLETLQDWQAKGRVKYIGVTTSHGARHDALEKIMHNEKIDFVQFTYNVLDREAEKRLLPLALERKLGVIINRPFQTGDLFDRFAKNPLPKWVDEFDCQNWAQFFLKFIISHPAVTCAIPATSQVAHMQENMGAAIGRLPTPELRTRMLKFIQQL